jgi:hypothetical protein
MTRLQAFFSTPARQALGWTALGILGILMAAGGVWFLTDDGGSPKLADASDATLSPTATATATRTATALPTQTATATATPSPSPTATATATSRPFTGDSSGSSGGGNDDGASEPTATPTLPPIVAAGDYCSNDSSSSPPNSVIGIFTIGGAPAPAGSAVSLAFDGVIGPARLTTAAGGYRVDYFAGPEACANRVGASIAVVYGGQFYPTGHTVGDSPGAPVVVTVAAP